MSGYCTRRFRAMPQDRATSCNELLQPARRQHKDGVYSGYDQPGSNTVGQTFCRGVQMTDSTGLARFTTIYPGWYSGRITHVHFRVY